ncbi:MAG: hypothetical protein R2713_03975 [Ilumatobacteraceae bacterium]
MAPKLHALDQQVQQLDGRRRVVEGSVARLVVEREPGGERAEPAVVGVVAQQRSGEEHRVDHLSAWERFPIRPCEGGVEEAEVEPDVVTGDHGVADEAEQ